MPVVDKVLESEDGVWRRGSGQAPCLRMAVPEAATVRLSTRVHGSLSACDGTPRGPHREEGLSAV